MYDIVVNFTCVVRKLGARIKKLYRQAENTEQSSPRSRNKALVPGAVRTRIKEYVASIFRHSASVSVMKNGTCSRTGCFDTGLGGGNGSRPEHHHHSGTNHHGSTVEAFRILCIHFQRSRAGS
ncbi:uncharacterized protein LOC126366445 [Pectinophora gossypiella]|uniref:uncharacterized protein LOC126366445 n=1 Tax=Pectinophora gossypiella TaxID=13191 RepID=UPI00214E5E2C|nr:uncharacterized protein LOC126366445 [Pectinophora gossypiella]